MALESRVKFLINAYSVSSGDLLLGFIYLQLLTSSVISLLHALRVNFSPAMCVHVHVCTVYVCVHLRTGVCALARAARGGL